MFRVQFVYQLPQHQKALSDLDTFPSSTTTSLLSLKPDSNIWTERLSLVTVDLEPPTLLSTDALYVSPPLQWTPDRHRQTAHERKGSNRLRASCILTKVSRGGGEQREKEIKRREGLPPVQPRRLAGVRVLF
ncbi:hypothetical protein Bca4012_101171 [Brassica carinata]